MDRFISPCPPATEYQREILAILAEECAEVTQRCMKILRFGVEEVQPGQELSNKERLSDEVGDMLALVEEAFNASLLSDYRVTCAKMKKPEKLKIYLQNQPPE